MIRFLTAGESHGKCLTLIVEGVPSGLRLSSGDIDNDLRRRQSGYGRGGRMKIESDRAEITSGVRAGETLGSPIAAIINNKDWENWQDVMSVESTIQTEKFTKPRPGHADLAGGIKYHHKDLRNVLERASARETASRVAAGAIAKRILEELGIYVISFVVSIENTKANSIILWDETTRPIPGEWVMDFQNRLDSSPLRCPDPEAEKLMIDAIDAAKADGDSLGGTFRILVLNAPPGLGSHIHWDRRLDARIAYAVMSIPAIKGVEIGAGFQTATSRGSQVHDEIFYDSESGFYRKSNSAGGIEGGISNGEVIVIDAAMKPIPTLMKPLNSVDYISKEPFLAAKERSDVCAVPAAGVVGEAVVAVEIANAVLEKFGGDNISEIKYSFEAYKKYLVNL